MNSLYLDAIAGKPVARTPIWIMRQAGRYLPEYRAIREKHDFISMYKTPELAAEVTLQPIRRFGFDAAILFSDILVIPEAMGLTLTFTENYGPKLDPRIITDQDIDNLNITDIEARLDFVPKAIRLINGELAGKTPLIGFSGSPFTLATYMAEGKPTKNFAHIKTLIYSRPETAHRLLESLTEAVIRYLVMQIKAGVHAVQIFDTWGGILPVHHFEQFSARYMKRIVTELRKYDIPVVLFSKGGMEIFRQLTKSGADMIGVDWMTDMDEARRLTKGKVSLQGNMDPAALYGTQDLIRAEVRRILQVFGNKSRHVFNLGHGILPDIPVENVRFLVDEVHRQSELIRRASQFNE